MPDIACWQPDKFLAMRAGKKGNYEDLQPTLVEAQAAREALLRERTEAIRRNDASSTMTIELRTWPGGDLVDSPVTCENPRTMSGPLASTRAEGASFAPQAPIARTFHANELTLDLPGEEG